MLLQAVEIGLNGVCLMSFDKERIKENLSLPYEPLMVLAIGKSAENIRLVDMPKGGDSNYYRENGVHYVPKLSIDDLIIE
jgi:nitroreductase